MFTVWTAPDSVRLTAGWWRWWCWVGPGPGDAMLQWSSLLGGTLQPGQGYPAHRAAALPTTISVSGGKNHGIELPSAHRPPVAALNIGSD